MNIPKECLSAISKNDEEADVGNSWWHIIKDEGAPTKRGLYLCYRLWCYRQTYALIPFDGEYWVDSSMPEDRIIAWCELPELPEGFEEVKC